MRYIARLNLLPVSPMRPWYSYVIFYGMLLAVIGSVHYYLWNRLVRAARLPQGPRNVLTLLIFALFAGLMLSMPAYRYLPGEWKSWLMFPVFVWMGTMFILLVLTGLRDGAHWVTLRLHAPTRHDPSRRLLLTRGGALGVGLLATGTSALSIHTALNSLHVRDVAVPLPRLPAALRGLTIVQLTDVHVGPTIGREFVSEIVRRVNALNPDLVVITGDLVDGSVEELRPHVAPLGDLKSRMGTYFVPGNHEYYSGLDAWLAHLAELGIPTLLNRHVTLRDGDRVLDLAGIDDPTGEPDMVKTLAGRNADHPLVVLAHQPRSISHVRGSGALLQISGHTHAGQIWPFNYLVRIVQPYVSGLHEDRDGLKIYVSPGTGYWGPPMRLGTQAEITRLILS
jgi:uncharacterized protein